MLDEPLPKYAIVELVVVGHQPFGLLVQDDSGQRGFVDRADIADDPAAGGGWPKVGDRIPGVVLGYTRDGRLRVSTRERDLGLVGSLANPADALQAWQAVRSAETGDTEVLEQFYQSPSAPALLRWALKHPTYSEEHKRALDLLSKAPKDLQTKLLGDAGGTW